MRNNNGKQPAPDRPGKGEETPGRPLPEPLSLLRGKRPARIVLLDDEACVRESMKIMLQFWFTGFVVIECSTGDEGLREIARKRPDLLITDNCHPGPRGEEMLHRLFRTPFTFPIIVSSAWVGSSPELQARLRSFPRFTIELVNKPFLAADFRAAVLKCLNPASDPPSKPREDG